MDIDDYLLTAASTLLRASEPALRTSLDWLSVHGGFVLDAPRTPHRRSLAGHEREEDAPLGFPEWLGRVRARGGTVRQVVVKGESRPGLPAHLAEAFSGGNVRLLEAGGRRYGVAHVQSRATRMGPPEFVDWVDAQRCAPDAWTRVAAAVSDSNALNGRGPVTTQEAPRYLVSVQGAEVFDLLSGQLVGEVQRAARSANGTAAVPPLFDPFFMSRPPSLSLLLGVESIDEDARLELEGPVSADELVLLFDAQTCRAEVWTRVEKKLAELDLPRRLEDAQAETLAMMHRMLLEQMQLACRAAKVPVVKPAVLGSRLGTFVEHMDAETRRSYLPERERLLLADNDAPWALWCFEDLGVASPPSPGPEKSGRNAERDYVHALEDIEAFARKHDSPFAQAFSLARFLLDSAHTDALFAPQTEEALEAQVKALPLSERQRDELLHHLPSYGELARMGVAPRKLTTLLSLDVANVFGGMGSWNDEVFANEAIAEEHARQSENLFNGLATLRALTVNLPD